MKAIFTFLLLSIFTLVKTNVILAQAVNEQDSLALVDLYNSTGGTDWVNNTGWLSGPVKNWFGININGNGKVDVLYLPDNNLTGIIPSSIGNLSELYQISLKNNNLTGPIPASLGNLSRLTSLELYYNKLNGSIPISFGNLPLYWLKINHNELSGAIPSSFGNLKGLYYLDLSENLLTGSIPASFGNMVGLAYLYLSFNQLTGIIPDSLGYLKNISEIYLWNNKLSGSIPPSLGNLQYLKELVLSYNQLTGIIPSSLASPPNIIGVILDHNQLSGNIPPSLGNIPNLINLTLNSNQLTGSIPTSFGNLSKLLYLELSNNQLTGSIPTSFGNLSKLITLNLSFNQLNGSIPSSVTQFKDIRSIYLDHNQFSGTIPIFEYLYNGYDLGLTSNQLTFDGMEEVVQTNPYTNYSPQANIPIRYNNGKLSVTAGGANTNNTYNWYKDNMLTKSIVGDSTFTPNTVGKYFVLVNNSIATQLTLSSDTINISTLPITSIYFTAQLKYNNVILQWQTFQEINTSNFIIQRSTDGISFTTIGKINAIGNNTNQSNYTYNDNVTGITANKFFYRLQIIDKDGKFTYSSVASITLSNTSQIIFYPNPVKNMLHINGLTPIASSLLSIVDLKGNIVLKTIIKDESYKWNVQSLSKGIYYLQIKSGNLNTTMKFIKE